MSVTLKESDSRPCWEAEALGNAEHLWKQFPSCGSLKRGGYQSCHTVVPEPGVLL